MIQAAKITSLNANIDGTFLGRKPEPRPENLTEVAQTVKALGTDLGVAFDGDADRAIFIDETGQTQMGDKTFAVVLKQLLIDNPNSQIVTPISSSTLIKDTADACRGECLDKSRKRHCVA